MVDPTPGIRQFLTAPNTDRALLSRSEFMEILTAQLTHQDPFDPMDNSEFLKQMVALEEIQASAALTDGMGAFMNFFQLSIASGAIGKTIVGINEAGNSIEALVEKVVVEGGNVLLDTADGRVPFPNVIEISLPPEPDPEE